MLTRLKNTTRGTNWFHLYEVSRVAKSMERKDEKLLFHGCTVLAGVNDKASAMDSCGSCTTM